MTRGRLIDEYQATAHPVEAGIDRALAGRRFARVEVRMWPDVNFV
jgi:hypothetical protein